MNVKVTFNFKLTDPYDSRSDLEWDIMRFVTHHCKVFGTNRDDWFDGNPDVQIDYEDHDETRN